MENKFQYIFLSALLLVGFAVPVHSEETAPIVNPGIDPGNFKAAKIDDEFFEVGGFGGIISIEDFGAVPMYGVAASFHATEDLFIQFTGGLAKAELSSYELSLGGNSYLISDADHQFLYYDFLVGLNWLPGETFITRKFAFKSSNYLVGGVGNTQFAGDNNFTWIAGVGYKLVLTDFLTWQYDIRDHMFYTELLADPKLSHNIQLSSGINLFF